ncbi:hypothetical protein FRC0507_00121 [Corynebacterium diphtheriae]|nr:hypothetical protein FRC0507_00121 [Corynebacterium diphtheriae]
MTASPVVVSNNILKRAFNEKIDISPMKLQKILYFLASEYKKKTGKTLFPEQFQAWQYGPVLYSVYSEFKNRGAKPIKSYGKDSAGKSYILSESSNPVFRSCLDAVWNATKDLSAAQLSRITHMQGSAWSGVYGQGTYITDEAVGADVTYRQLLGLTALPQERQR